jgi:hypothetical protein
MSNYFLSFTSTFESLLLNQLTIADLAGGILVLGCKPEHVLLPYDLIPIEVTCHNTVKPKRWVPGQHSHEKTNTVSRDKIDPPVLKAWDAFAAQLRKASTEGRLIFMRDVGHPSYRHFSRDVVRRGDRAFWKGKWVTLEEVVRA